jgi:hypothetical protein
MKQPLSTYDIMLSIAYVIILALVFTLLDFGFIWLLNHAILNLFNWFNHLGLFWKLSLLIIGGGSLLLTAFYLFTGLAAFFSSLIFRHFPTNYFTEIIGFLIAVANTIYLVIKLWELPTHYNFWIVIELLILSIFVWSFAAIVRTKKHLQPDLDN